MEIAKAVKRARVGAGKTQAQLAEDTKVSQAAVHSWEAGKTAPTWAHLDAIAAACGMSVHEMLEPEDETPPPTDPPEANGEA